MPDFMTIDTFAGLERTRFQMHCGGDRSVELELQSVTDVGSSPRQQQFSLIFLGPGDAPLSQGIYQLDHEKLGTLNLFLVPVARDNRGVSYEAIFNRVFE